MQSPSNREQSSTPLVDHHLLIVLTITIKLHFLHFPKRNMRNLEMQGMVQAGCPYWAGNPGPRMWISPWVHVTACHTVPDMTEGKNSSFLIM